MQTYCCDTFVSLLMTKDVLSFVQDSYGGGVTGMRKQLLHTRKYYASCVHNIDQHACKACIAGMGEVGLCFSKQCLECHSLHASLVSVWV